MEFFLSEDALFLLIGLFLVGAVASLLAGARINDGGRVANAAAHAMAALGSVVGLGMAFAVLYRGRGVAWLYSGPFPLLELSFRIDGMGAYFLALASLVALLASVYGYGYLQHFIGSGRLGSFGFFYNLFVGSLLLIPIANQALFFLLVWELMSLASYFLVVFEHEKAENVRAGFVYFLMTHFGTAFIILACLLAYQATGSFSFDTWREAFGTLSPTGEAFILGFALIGFATKAGLIPLHIWLPEAHPAAPSHVSALMSGIMVKTALFMLFRFFFDFFQGARVEWGVAFLIIGSVSALLGILYANAERDLKRLLAYSTVENVGIITIAFGAGLTLFALGQERVALFALAAALYHLLNHAVFKSLLFLGAGSVVSRAGTRNLEAYGGLLRVMPYTATFFLVGSLAIAALPPFNGFVSEWLTFQVLFAGVIGSPLAVKIAFLIALTSLVFTSGLAVACFVKVFGTTFLARPRSAEAKAAKEVSWIMVVPMGVLALLSLVLGLASSPVLAGLTGIVASIGLTNPATLGFPFLEIVASRHAFADVLPLATVAILLIVILVAITVAVRLATRGRCVVIGSTWDCGFPLSGRNEITATSFSRSLVTIFRGILQPTKQSTIEYHDDQTRYFIKSVSIETGLRDVYRERLYRPVNAALHFLADRIRLVQTGNVNVYILYFALTFLGVLLWATHS